MSSSTTSEGGDRDADPDRETYFDVIYPAPFGGAVTQDWVDGQEAILTRWEAHCEPQDLRWLGYELATTYHETGRPCSRSRSTGKGRTPLRMPDPVTGKTYYGRGIVQHYEKMADITDQDLVYNPDLALTDDTPTFIASTIMFEGICRGSFTGKKLAQYFSDTKDDPPSPRDSTPT